SRCGCAGSGRDRRLWWSGWRRLNGELRVGVWVGAPLPPRPSTRETAPPRLPARVGERRGELRVGEVVGDDRAVACDRRRGRPADRFGRGAVRRARRGAGGGGRAGQRGRGRGGARAGEPGGVDRKSTRLNSSHVNTA